MSKYKFEIGETVKIRKDRRVGYAQGVVADRYVDSLGHRYGLTVPGGYSEHYYEGSLKRIKPKRGAIIRGLIARVESLERDRDAASQAAWDE